jgi:hypothetical protein
MTVRGQTSYDANVFGDDNLSFDAHVSRQNGGGSSSHGGGGRDGK